MLVYCSYIYYSKIRIKRFIYNQFEVSFIKMDNYNQHLQKQQQNHYDYMDDYIIPRGNQQHNNPIRDSRGASYDYMDDLQNDLHAQQHHNIRSLHDIEITESCLDVVGNPRPYHNRQDIYNSTRYQPPHTIPSINQQALNQGYDMHMSQHKSNMYRAENDLDFLQDNLSNLKSINNKGDQISLGSVKDIFQRERSNSHEYSLDRDAKKKFGFGDFVETVNAHNPSYLYQEDNYSNRTPAIRSSQLPFMQQHVNNHYEQHQRRDRHESRQLDSIGMSNYQKHQQQNMRQPTDDYYNQKPYGSHVIQPDHQTVPQPRKDDQKYGLSIQEIQDLQISKLENQNPSKRKKLKKFNQNLHQQKTHTLEEIQRMTEQRHRSHVPSQKLGGKKDQSLASKSTGIENINKDPHRQQLHIPQEKIQPQLPLDRNDPQQRFQQQLDIKTDVKLDKVVVEKIEPIKQIEPITRPLIPPPPQLQPQPQPEPPQKKMSMKLCLDFSDANTVKEEPTAMIPPVQPIQPVAPLVDHKKKPSKIITLDFTKSLPKPPSSRVSSQIEPVKPIEPLKSILTASQQIKASDIHSQKGQSQAMSVKNSEKATEQPRETPANNYPPKKKTSPPKVLNKAAKQSSQRNLLTENLAEDKNFDDQDSTKANLGKRYCQQDPDEETEKKKLNFDSKSYRPITKPSAKTIVSNVGDICSQEANKPDSQRNSGITDYSFYNSKKEMKKLQQAQQITQKPSLPTDMVKKGNNGPPVVSQIRPLTSIFDVTKMQSGTKINMNLDEQNSEKFSRKRQSKPTATRTSRFNMENNHQKDNVFQSLPDQVQHLIAGAAQHTNNQGTQAYRAQTVAPPKHPNPQQHNYNFQEQQKIQLQTQTQSQQQISIQQNRGTSQRTPPNVQDVNHQNISIGSYIKQEYIINIHMDQNGQQQQPRQPQLQPTSGQQSRATNNTQQPQIQNQQTQRYSDSELQIPVDSQVVTELRAKPAVRKSNQQQLQQQPQKQQQPQQPPVQPVQPIQAKEEKKKFGPPPYLLISPEQFRAMDEEEQQAVIDFLKSHSKNRDWRQQVNRQQQPGAGQTLGNQQQRPPNEVPNQTAEVVAQHQNQAENNQKAIQTYGARMDARSDCPDVNSDTAQGLQPFDQQSDFSQYQVSIQARSPIKRAPVIVPPQPQQPQKPVPPVQQAAPPVDQNKLNEYQKKLMEQQQKMQQNAMVKQQLQEVVQKIDSITRQKAFGARAASSSSNLSNLANGSDSEGLNYYFQDQTSVARQEASDYAHDSLNQQQQIKNLMQVLPHLQEQIQKQIQKVPNDELIVLAERLPHTHKKTVNLMKELEGDIDNLEFGVPSKIEGPVGTIKNVQPVDRHWTMQDNAAQKQAYPQDHGSPNVRNKRLQKQSSKASSLMVYEDSPEASESRSPKKRARQERLGDDPFSAQDSKTPSLKKIFKIEKERTVNINWEVNRDVETENLSVEPFQSDTDTVRFRTYSYEARREDQINAAMNQTKQKPNHDTENKMKEVRLLNQSGVQVQQPKQGSLMVSLQIQEEDKEKKEALQKQESSEAIKPDSPKRKGKPRKAVKEKPAPAEVKTPKKRGRKPRQQSSTKLVPDGELAAPIPPTPSGQNSRRQTRNMKDEEPKEGGFLVPTPKQSMEINSSVFHNVLKQTPPKRKRSRKLAAKEQAMDINQNQEKPPGLGTDKKEGNTGKIVPRRRKKAASTKTSEQSYEPRVEKHQMTDEDYDPVAHGHIQPLFSTERNAGKGAKPPERPKTRFAKEQTRFQEHFASINELSQGMQSQHFAGMARQGLHDLQQTNNSAQQYQLVPCEKYQSFENQPYRIYFTFEVQMLMCIHAYLSKHEVIGLLGGKCYDSTDTFEGQPIKYIIITKIYQSDSCTNHALRQKNCEISDAQQIRIQDQMDKDKVQKVAWYHSHPIFDVDPSMQDLVTHYQQQVEFDRQGLPFIGVIVGPYYPKQDLDNTLINVFNLKQQPCSKDPNQSRNPRRTVLQNLKEQGRSFHYRTIPKIKIKYSWYYEIKSMIKHNAQLKKDNPNLSGEWAYKKAQKKVYQLLNREAQQSFADTGADHLKHEDHALDTEDNSRQVKLRFSRQEKFILSLKKLCEINCEQHPKFNIDKQIRDRILVTENNELSVLNSQLRSCEAIALKEAERSPDFDKKFQSNYTMIVKDQTISEYFWVSDEKQIIKTIFKIEQSVIKEFELATKSFMEQLFNINKQRQQQLNNRKESQAPQKEHHQIAHTQNLAPKNETQDKNQQKHKEDLLNSRETEKVTPMQLVKHEHNQEDTMPRNLVINLSPRKKEDHMYSSHNDHEDSAVSMNFAALIENENRIKTQIPAIKPVSAIRNPLLDNPISQVQEQFQSNLESIQGDFKTKEKQ